jgi:hypothetical protein
MTTHKKTTKAAIRITSGNAFALIKGDQPKHTRPTAQQGCCVFQQHTACGKRMADKPFFFQARRIYSFLKQEATEKPPLYAVE